MLMKNPLKVTSVNVATVRGWHEGNEVLLVDVREPSEFEKEHIAGAFLLPMSGFDADLFPALVGKKVVLYCAIGKRSEAAGKMLLNAGHEGILHMQGGLKAWKEAGFEIEEELLPPIPAPKARHEGLRPARSCPRPGAVLVEEYLTPQGMGIRELAEKSGVSGKSLRAVIAGEKAVDALLSIRLARAFSTTPDFWARLQMDYDLERACNQMSAASPAAA